MPKFEILMQNYFIYLADAFIQNDLQNEHIIEEKSKPTKEQQHASAITSPG